VSIGVLTVAVGVRDLFFIARRITFETDPRTRVLRIEREIPWRAGAEVRSYSYEDCCEIAIEQERLVNCRLSIFTRGEGWKPLATFAGERQAEVRDLARRLAAEVGCLSCKRAFPFDDTVARTIACLVGITFLLLVVYPAVDGLVAKPPLTLPGLRRGVLFGLAWWSPFVLCAWMCRPACRVRVDHRRRVVSVRRRRLLGWHTRNHPYDDIAEIVATSQRTDDRGGAGKRTWSHAVLIVPRDDLARADGSRQRAGSSGPRRDDTVFHSTDRQSVRLTAERLARRIGRPWRDATV
jgi:hypothetical protein